MSELKQFNTLDLVYTGVNLSPEDIDAEVVSLEDEGNIVLAVNSSTIAVKEEAGWVDKVITQIVYRKVEK